VSGLLDVEPALLVLEDGRVFRGRAYGAIGETFGEAVFTTGMSGYQETLTDPSYHRQVVVQTSPHIGNYGVNDDDAESRRIWVAGYVVRDPSRVASNWRSERTLDHDLVEQGIDEVSVEEEYVVPAVGTTRFVVAAVDLGIKGATPRHMSERGIEVHVLPSTTTPERMLEVGVDGVFFSNGPGDPATADHAVALVRAALEARRPLFGICFGNQLLGRALGFGTYKLKYGHRGINVPVLDRVSGTVEITAQNHGFAVAAPIDRVSETPYGHAEVSHICLNDDVVEGLRCLDVPAFSVQYHPEAAAGPHDSAYLFDRFCDLMEATRAQA
jgi:carbamoyl-phosphate synthase small subunit